MKHEIMHHGWLMMLACLIPLLLLAILPSLGYSGRWISYGAIGLMIILHFWFMKGHGNHTH